MVMQGRLEEDPNADRRSSPRRRISLGSNLGQTGIPVLIHDLSSTGMLVETGMDLPLFEGIEIGLPEVGDTRAIVIWSSGRYYGCEFTEPLSKAVMSAALLRSQPTAARVPAKPRPFVVIRPHVLEAHEQIDEPPPETVEEEKASLTVRLRVILGITIFLWTLIIFAVRALVKLAR